MAGAALKWGGALIVIVVVVVVVAWAGDGHEGRGAAWWQGDNAGWVRDTEDLSRGGGGRFSVVIVTIIVVSARHIKDLNRQPVTTGKVERIHVVDQIQFLRIVSTSLEREFTRPRARERRILNERAVHLGEVAVLVGIEIALALVARDERGQFLRGLGLGVPGGVDRDVGPVAIERPDVVLAVGIGVSEVVDELEAALLVLVAGRHVKEGQGAVLDDLAVGIGDELHAEERGVARLFVVVTADDVAPGGQEGVAGGKLCRAVVDAGICDAGGCYFKARLEGLGEFLGVSNGDEAGGGHDSRVLHVGGEEIAL